MTVLSAAMDPGRMLIIMTTSPLESSYGRSFSRSLAIQSGVYVSGCLPRGLSLLRKYCSV